MVKRKIQISTCLLLGLIGAGISSLTGLLMALHWGYFGYFRLAAFAMTGAMLLFCATLQQGKPQKGLRTKLLLLFFALLVSIFDLPLLCPPLEAIVLPLFFLLYPALFSKKQFYSLLGAEILFALIRTLAITDLFGTKPEVVVGFAWLLLSLLRGVFLLLAFRRAKLILPLSKEEPLHTLQ